MSVIYDMLTFTTKSIKKYFIIIVNFQHQNDSSVDFIIKSFANGNEIHWISCHIIEYSVCYFNAIKSYFNTDRAIGSFFIKSFT